MNTKETRAAEYYMGLEYPITVYKAEEGGYVAEIEDLPGCITEGESLQEVINKIEEVKKAWIEVAYEDGVKIPLPRNEREYSGKFVTRIPKYLHQHLAELAAQENVSLNQMVETILSAGISIHAENKKIDDLVTKIDQLDKKLSNPIQPIWMTPGWELESKGLKLHIPHEESNQIHEKIFKGVMAA
jgi:predicted RNase H-like HicB family nuclease